MPGVLSAADLQIEHVTIVSPERASPMRDALVRVHDGRIVAITKTGGAAAQSSKDSIAIDGSGLFLAPGLIDSHVHLGEIPGMTPEQEASIRILRKPRGIRFRAVSCCTDLPRSIDLISTPQEMVRWKNHDIVPDTYFCGGAVLMDGYAMNFAPKPQRYPRGPTC